MISARYALLGRCRSKDLIELVGNSLGWCLFVPNVNCSPGAFVLGSGERGLDRRVRGGGSC
jgi:hypothetical protein